MRFLIFLLFFGCLGFAMKVEKSWKRAVIVLTSDVGLDDLDQPLKYAKQDGKKLINVLNEVGQIPPDMSYWVHENSPTAFMEELEKVKIDLFANKGEHPLFLQVYYSGHGSGSNFHVGNGKIEFDDVKKILGLDEVEAKLFVLDVCFGASFFEAKGFKKVEPIQLGMELGEWTRGEALISSSALNEQAFEVKDYQGSVFTTHWSLALRGAADQNKDGQVSLFEAYNYTYDQTLKYTSETLQRPQHPSYQMDFTGARDLVLSRPIQANSGLLFNEVQPGMYSISDSYQNVNLGEIRISETGNYTLALAPGAYEISRNGKRGGRFVQTAQVGNSVFTLKEDGFSFREIKNLKSKGGVKDEEKLISEESPKEIILGLEMVYNPFGLSNPSFNKNLTKTTALEEKLKIVKNEKSSERKNPIGFLAHLNIHKLLLVGGFQFEEAEYIMEGTGAESFIGTEYTTPIFYEQNVSVKHTIYEIGIGLRIFELFQIENWLMLQYASHSISFETESALKSQFRNTVLFSQFNEEYEGNHFALQWRWQYPLLSETSSFYLSLNGWFSVERIFVKGLESEELSLLEENSTIDDTPPSFEFMTSESFNNPSFYLGFTVGIRK